MILVAEAVGNCNLDSCIRSRSDNVEHMRVHLALVVLLVELVEPEGIRQVKTDEHLRALRLFTDNLQLFAVLGNLNLPVVSPIPHVNHYGVINIPLCIVGSIWEFVEKYARLAIALEVVAYGVHIEAAELLLCRQLRRVEVPLYILVVDGKYLAAGRLAQ